jgi:hypothetical protein
MPDAGHVVRIGRFNNQEFLPTQRTHTDELQFWLSGLDDDPGSR